MKKIIKSSVLSIVVLLVIFGCAVTSVPSKASFGGGEYSPIDSNVDLTAAREIADIKLEQIAKDSDDWTEESRIVKSYPIYTPGIDGISHYEFKVKTGDSDAGYILVSLTDADIQVPELSTTGKTLTEQYQEATKRSDIKVVRYNWFESVAVSTSIEARNIDGNEIIATLGTGSNGMRVK